MNNDSRPMVDSYEATSALPHVGRYDFLAETFQCDCTDRLFLGAMVNRMLNAADFHSTDRQFGMHYLQSVGRTWVLSRLVVEMDQMPRAFERFSIETWIESAMRFFTNRNFAVLGADGHPCGYGRSTWAMIDTATRQPADLFTVHDGLIRTFVDAEKPCPIGKFTRVRMGDEAEPQMLVTSRYSDVDLNGHVNSAKYIEHILDLWPLDWHRQHRVRRFEIAYVAECHAGDELRLYREELGDMEFAVRIMRHPVAPAPGEATAAEVEAVRARVVFC